VATEQASKPGIRRDKTIVLSPKLLMFPGFIGTGSHFFSEMIRFYDFVMFPPAGGLQDGLRL
jgi:hypothetical protein